MIYSLPASSHEIGALVQQISELDDARAVIIDYMQKSIIVHPKSEDDTAVFTTESLTYVLASQELEMLESVESWENRLRSTAEDNEETPITFCIHPESQHLKVSKGEVLWTTLVSRTAVLLVSQKVLSNHKIWRIRGMHILTDQP
tara:strand:- start:556 stop:990 length:435 start_codon:yes stop_codon:yes gene_type:complete